jgi:hypothetical protein
VASNNKFASLYPHLSPTVVLTVVGCIPGSRPSNIDIHLPASKSAIIFNSVSKAGTTLGLSLFTFDLTNMNTDFT